MTAPALANITVSGTLQKLIGLLMFYRYGNLCCQKHEICLWGKLHLVDYVLCRWQGPLGDTPKHELLKTSVKIDAVS